MLCILQRFYTRGFTSQRSSGKSVRHDMGLASYHDFYLIARQGGNLASLENYSIHFVHQGLELLSSYWQACCQSQQQETGLIRRGFYSDRLINSPVTQQWSLEMRQTLPMRGSHLDCL